jgi:hypothetical protein
MKLFLTEYYSEVHVLPEFLSCATEKAKTVLSE